LVAPLVTVRAPPCPACSETEREEVADGDQSEPRALCDAPLQQHLDPALSCYA
jgi:hypothetical protein